MAFGCYYSILATLDCSNERECVSQSICVTDLSRIIRSRRMRAKLSSEEVPSRRTVFRSTSLSPEEAPIKGREFRLTLKPSTKHRIEKERLNNFLEILDIASNHESSSDHLFSCVSTADGGMDMLCAMRVAAYVGDDAQNCNNDDHVARHVAAGRFAGAISTEHGTVAAPERLQHENRSELFVGTHASFRMLGSGLSHSDIEHSVTHQLESGSVQRLPRLRLCTDQRKHKIDKERPRGSRCADAT